MTRTTLHASCLGNCGHRFRLAAIHGVPREKYERRCPKCRLTWTIARTTIREGTLRMDRLEWGLTEVLDRTGAVI